MDKASPPHYKAKKVKKYFEDNNETLISLFLPTASPKSMVMGEIWNIAKQYLLALKYYVSFTGLKNKISTYLEQKDSIYRWDYLLRSGL